MPPILSLYFLLFFVTICHLAIVVYNGMKFYLPNKFFGSIKYNYRKFDTKSNGLRLGLSLSFLFGPIIITLVLRSFKFEDELFVTVIQVLLILTTIYLLHLNYYKIWSDSFRTVKNPNITAKKKLRDNYKISKQNEGKILKFRKDVDEMDHSKLEKEVDKINKQILAKTRKSKKLDEKKDIINKQFESLIEDLKSNFPNYNHKERSLEDIRKYDLTELQAYQTLIAFFREKYNVPQDYTLAPMFRIFNDHFNMKEKKLKSNNWNDFKDRLLPDLKNNTFYSDLCLFMNK